MDWPAILTAFTGILVAFGGGIKWMLFRMDLHEQHEREWQTQERTKLEAQFVEHISALENRLLRQEQELEMTRTELRAYVRHVGVLEGLLKAHSVEIPPLELPRHG